MAQSASNVTIGVGVDIGEVRTQLSVVSGYLQKFQAEVKAAIRSGDTAREQSATASLRYWNQQKAHWQELTKGAKEAGGALNELSKKVFELGERFGVSLGGVRLLKLGLAGLVAVETVRAISAVVERINELNNAARDAGTNPQTLKAVRDAFERIGEPAQKADGLLAHATKSLHEFNLAQIQAGQASGSGVEVLKGSIEGATRSLQDFQMVARGGDRRPIDFGITQGRATLQQMAQEVLAIKDPILQDEAALKRFGGTMEQLKTGLEALAKGPPLARVVTPEQQKATDDYNRSMFELKQLWEDLGNSTILTLLTSVNDAFKADLETIESVVQAFKRLNGAVSALGKSLPSWLTTPLPSPNEAGLATNRAIRRLLSGSSGPSTAGDGGGKLIDVQQEVAQQGGGYISGPGSGTSDSIPARLSNGEFVINARSAARAGYGLLHRINRLAGGGYASDERLGSPEDVSYYGPSLSSKFQATLARDRPRVRGAQFPYIPGARTGPEVEEARRRWRTVQEIITSAGVPIGGSDPTAMMGRAQQFLSKLVSFPTGDYLSQAPVKFASGGLVGGGEGGGNAVAHFHFENGRTFALKAGGEVLGAMVKEANMQQIRSAGVKPSWFAGKPSGR